MVMCPWTLPAAPPPRCNGGFPPHPRWSLHVSVFRLLVPVILALAPALPAAAAPAAGPGAQPPVVTAKDLHLEALRPSKTTYLVYMHRGPDSGIARATIATSEVARERVDGTDAWVITQHWQDESGVVHSARTVQAASDLETLSQTSTWRRPTGTFTSIVVPREGRGEIEGELPDAARERMQAGFAAMRDGWWLNWHTDLTVLPLLPYEKGGTLRIRLFDVGMPAPIEVDYVVAGERRLQGADGTVYDCWLVETDSGSPGSGSVQRFWIDKARRIVVKEEDIFNGQYRSKMLLTTPATVEFEMPQKQS